MEGISKFQQAFFHNVDANRKDVIIVVYLLILCITPLRMLSYHP